MLGRRCWLNFTALKAIAMVTSITPDPLFGELRRICAFPDDFVLVGSYAQQRERLGNAVPPVIMMHIAAVVRDGVLARVSCGTDIVLTPRAP